MKNERLLQLQQMEFFLLHSLLVDELHLIRNVKRFAPAHTRSATDGKAALARLFKSFLIKLFARARVTKQPNCLSFTVGFDKDTRSLLEKIGNSDHDADLRTPTAGEIGLLRVDLPHSVTVSLGGHTWRRRRYYSSGDPLADNGIGKFCGAAKTVAAWKGRLDLALAVAANHNPTADEPARNIAQEQLDAVLRMATRGAQ